MLKGDLSQRKRPPFENQQASIALSVGSARRYKPVA